MAQHLWLRASPLWRACEVCLAIQCDSGGAWLPDVNPICPGDPHGDGRHGLRGRPRAPTDAAPPRALEEAST